MAEPCHHGVMRTWPTNRGGKPWDFAIAVPRHRVPCSVPSPTQALRISAQLQCLFPRPIPSPTQALRISAQLQCLFPDPPIPLDHASPFQLLTAVMLSAQVGGGDRGVVVGADKGRGHSC